MKKIIILLTTIFILTSCYSNPEDTKKIADLKKQIQENNLKEKEFIFNKNKECYNSLSNLKLPEKDFSGGNLSIGKIWYSSNKNKCYYIIIHSYSDFSKKRGIYEGFQYWSTQRPIEHCNSSLELGPINPTKNDKKISEHWSKLCNEYYIFLKENNFYD